jgi:hypothetical protein
MYEIIEKQFLSRKAIVQNKYNSSIRKDKFQNYYWELYPLGQDYYHEFNPFFLFNIYHPNLFKFAPILTVKDGYLTFASFIIKNFTFFNKLEIGKFLIHPDLVPLVPPAFSDKFATWNIVQKKTIQLEEAKKILVFGYVSDHYLGNFDKVKLKIKKLKKLRPDAIIDIYVPLRRNIFEEENKESVLIHQLMIQLKEVLGDKSFRILTSDQFFEISDFNNTLLIDLAEDRFLISDNFLYYHVLSRGGSVYENVQDRAPANSIFNIDLSLYHEFHISPLPESKSFFTELLFYKKQNPLIKDPVFDPSFHSLLRVLLKKEEATFSSKN